MTVANKPGAPGRARSSRKTIAWGMPGDSGVTCQRVCVLPTTIAHTAIGRIGRPAFPAPFVRRAGIRQYLAQKIVRRDRGRMSQRHCEERLRRSDLRSNKERKMDCFAALAMTASKVSANLRRAQLPW